MTMTSMPSPLLRHTAGRLGSLAPMRVTAHEYTRESLRSSILAGGLPAGTRLMQMAIAKQLGVSTTPVREALRDLASEGLVHHDPHRGAMVTGLDHTDLADVYDTLGLIEPAMIRRVFSYVSPPDIAALRRLQDDLDTAAGPDEWATLETRFHTLLAHVAKSPRLESMTKAIRIAAFRYLGQAVAEHPECIGQLNTEHHDLIAMLSAGRVEPAVQLTSSHLEQIEVCVLRNTTSPATSSPEGGLGLSLLSTYAPGQSPLT